MTERMDDCVAQIGILSYPGCQLAAVHGLTDLFRIATEWTDVEPGRFIRVTHWAVVETEGEAAVTCVHDTHPGPPHGLDHIIVPPSIVMPEHMETRPPTALWLTDWHDEGTRICSVCAGAFVLAQSGLIDGRRVTTHWAFAQELAARFPSLDVADEQMILDDGDIITAGGILAWTDLGLTLVERMLGPSVMLATARFLIVDPPRRSQRPFAPFVPRFDHGDERVLRVQHHIHAHAAEHQTLAALAQRAGLADRTFLRRFSKATGLKPIEYVQNVRIAKARAALETTARNVDQIAWQVGYTDAAAFRKVFHRLTRLTPQEYRRRFGTGRPLHPA